MDREPGNPYQPPAAVVRDLAPRRGSPVKAVLYGVLIDIGGSFGGGVVLVLAYSIVLASSGASAEDIQRALSASDPVSWLSIAGFAIGTAASFLGGFVCARVARLNERRWVGIVASVSALVSLLTGADFALEWNAVLALASMATVFAGGWAGERSNRRRAA